MKRKALLGLISASMLTIIGGGIAQAYDENLNMYTLDTVVVEADKTKNKFGDTITEQSYYRTGGDVKVITREEIEKRHYNDITDAIKRIPGVTFYNPGYRGGEYGFANFNNGVSINGDFHVVILLDGVRMDNLTSTRVGKSSTANKSTGVNLNHVTNMDNIEKIEVIKGPGAAAYGADAAGGVINIITRKGGQKPVVSVDVSTGNWKQHNYNVSASGSAGKDKSVKYFISANRSMSGDSKYVDGWTGQEATFYGSKWKEDGFNARIDKEFNERQNLKISYNHKDGWDGYPIWTPKTQYWNQKDFQATLFRAMVGRFDENYKLTSLPMAWDSTNPGYVNLFQIDSGVYKSFNRFNNNDLDVTYTFNKENGMESFIRYFNQQHTYISGDTYEWGYINGSPYSNAYYKGEDGKLVYPFYDDYISKFPNGATHEEFQNWYNEHLCPFPGADESILKEWVDKTGGYAKDKPTSYREQSRGLQLQYAKSLGIHDIISNVTYNRGRTYKHSQNRNTKLWEDTYTQRKSVYGYVQDKMHLTDKWDFTPTLRYSWYSSFSHKNADGSITDSAGNSSDLSYTLNSEYMFNDSTSFYVGWVRIFRPISEADYTEYKQLYEGHKLQNEKGDAWTFGLRKEITPNTTFRVNYALTKMSNAIAQIPLYNLDTGKFITYKLNAKEDKQSFNMTLDSQINDHWTVSAGYSHMKDKWSAKDGWTLPSDYDTQRPADLNTAINHLRPQNHYSLNVSYQNDKLYSGVLFNYYTGLNTKYFSDNRYLIIDWNVNYEVNKNMTLYAVVNNLTNKGYETSYDDYYGGAAMSGRSMLFGAKYKF